MTRKYADISHFRAPFKNYPYLSGLGEAPIPAPPNDGLNHVCVPGVTVEPWAGAGICVPIGTNPATAVANTEKSGVRIYKPEIVDAILKMLPSFSVVFLDDNNVKLEARLPSDIRESADSWVKKKVASGKTVVAGSTGGVVFFVAPAVVDRYLSAVSSTQDELVATGGLTPLGAVLIRPTMFASLFGRLGPVGVAAVALAGVGAVYMVSKKGRRRATPNRRRRRRR